MCMCACVCVVGASIQTYTVRIMPSKRDFLCVRVLLCVCCERQPMCYFDHSAGVRRENLDDLLIFDHDYGLIASVVHLCSANFFASAIRKQERRTERKGGEEERGRATGE